MTSQGGILNEKNGPKQSELFDLQPTRPPIQEPESFSKYIVYVDESGDHSLTSVDETYPVFVLALCVFHKRHYAEKVVPAVQALKFEHFGHDIVVLHENEIRKEKGIFKFPSATHRQSFLGKLTDIMDASKFVLISCAIDKRRFKGEQDSNPYHIALQFCLEALYKFLEEKSEQEKTTHIVFEARGKKEDAELELEFRRVCGKSNRRNLQLPFEIIIADKKVNSAGLQVADLVARPIGLRVIRPEQQNRAFDVLKTKLLSNGGRKRAGTDFENAGLRIFPAQESEKPR